MSLAVVGISHRTAPVEVRERLAFSRADVPAALQRLIGTGTSSEAVLLSTCNRTEIYFIGSNGEAEATVRRLLEEQWTGPQPLSGFLYAQRGRAAVDHLIRWMASAESGVWREKSSGCAGRSLCRVRIVCRTVSIATGMAASCVTVTVS